MAFTFQIKNIQTALANIDKYSKEVQQNIDDEMTKTAYNIVNEAQTLAPVDDGNLRASIHVAKDAPLEKLIEASAEYAVYVEAGTGGLVDIPSEPEGLAQYFIQFKGRGIRQVNLPARPFLFPAVQRYTIEMIKNFKLILEKNVV